MSPGAVAGAVTHAATAAPPAGTPTSRPHTRPTIDWQRTIVDTTSRLPKGYVPPDLVTVSRAGLSGGGSIRRIAIADLKALAIAARKARVRLAVESAYRSEARQQRTFAGWVRTSGEAEARRFSARAGTLGAPARDRHRFQGGGRRVPVDAEHSRARGMRDGWRRMPGGSAGSRAIRRVRRHRPATALRPGTTAMSDGTSPPRSTRRG